MGSSIKLSMLALLCGIAVLTGVQAECQTTAEGSTWSYQADRDEILFDISSAQACLASCYDDPDCAGFTWETEGVIDICYKFQILEGQHTCNDCQSGTIATIFHEETCNLDTSQVITVVTTNSSDSCYQSCVSAEGCVGYTWYNQLTTIPYYCFLYGKCSDTIPCPGCSTGMLNCILPGPSQCHEYKILDDPTRNEDHGYEEHHCDDDDFNTSPDWQGSAYYRVQAPAGDKIPTSSPGKYHCGTWASGWINDEDGAIDQMEEGQEISARVCFHADSDPCYRSTNITVTKCPGDFLVYHLANALSCFSRYCAK